MKYFYLAGRYYYTFNSIPEKGVEYTREEWADAKSDYKEVHGNVANFSTQYEG